MRLRLVDLNPSVTAAWREAFADDPRVTVSDGDILAQGDADAIVSPANSHGWMDGGIDLAYARRWPEVEARTQALIRDALGGFLPVGSAVSIVTGEASIPVMICAPTMAEPGPVPHTANAFLAMRAALRVAYGIQCKVLLCPGLCTLTGRMPARVAAWQMRAAWEASDV